MFLHSSFQKPRSLNNIAYVTIKVKFNYKLMKTFFYFLLSYLNLCTNKRFEYKVTSEFFCIIFLVLFDLFLKFSNLGTVRNFLENILK